MQPRAGQSRAQIARPAARYRPGKSLAGQAEPGYSSDEGSSQEEAHASAQASSSKQQDMGLTYFQVGHGSNHVPPGKKDITLDLKDVRVGAGDVVDESEYETDTEEEEESRPSGSASRSAIGTLPARKKGSSEEYETDESSEEEESSEDEVKKPIMVKPLFVPKNRRTTTAVPPEAPGTGTISALPQEVEKVPPTSGLVDEEALAELREAEKQKQRKLQSQQLAAQSIGRQLLEKAAAEAVPDLDDTDGLDPEAEFQSWRLRELERLARERSKVEAQAAEKAEIERRRALPSAQRDAEDTQHAEKTRREKLERRREALALASADGGTEASSAVGAGGKYYHKGAFYQGGADEDEIFKRDYQGLTEGQVDMKLLPKVMQVKDYGKKGRSKYTNLKDQDTSRAGRDARFEQRKDGEGSGGCFQCGGDHLKRDCPEALAGSATSGAPGRTSTGANSYRADARPREWGGGVRNKDDQHDQSNGRRNDYRGRDHERHPFRSHEERDPLRRPRMHDDGGGERRRERSRDRDGLDRHRAAHLDERSRDKYSSRMDELSSREARKSRSDREDTYVGNHPRKRRRSRSRSPRR